MVGATNRDFDGKGIALKDFIRLTANTEGAHSPPVSRLMLPSGEKDDARFRVVKDAPTHIASHITVCGLRYSHAIVVETAFFLYAKLAKNANISEQSSDVSIPLLCFVPENAFGPGQTWLAFDGGLTISFGSSPQFVAHRIKAPR